MGKNALLASLHGTEIFAMTDREKRIKILLLTNFEVSFRAPPQKGSRSDPLPFLPLLQGSPEDYPNSPQHLPLPQ